MLQREVVEVDLVPVPYHVEGEGDPVIMIHLPTSPHHCFCRNQSEIAKHFKVYVVDLRPAVVLKTWRIRKIPLLDFLESIVLGFMDKLGIERVRLVGGHKAGAVSMYLAARHPNRVHKLVLYSTLGLSRAPSRAPVFKVLFFFMRWPGVLLMGRVRWIRRYVKWLDLRGAGQWRVRQFFGPNEPHDKYTLTRHLVEVYTTFLKPPDVWAYEVMIFTIRYLRYEPVAAIVPNITQKTLLVFGDDPYGVPPKVIEDYSRLIKNSEVITVENTRLYPHYEKAEEINRKTIEFLKND